MDFAIHVFGGHDRTRVHHDEAVVSGENSAVAEVRQKGDSVGYFGDVTNLTQRIALLRWVFAAPEAIGQLNDVH